jgi:hypothetical protein
LLRAGRTVPEPQNKYFETKGSPKCRKRQPNSARTVSAKTALRTWRVQCTFDRTVRNTVEPINTQQNEGLRRHNRRCIIRQSLWQAKSGQAKPQRNRMHVEHLNSSLAIVRHVEITPQNMHTEVQWRILHRIRSPSARK